MFVMSDKTYEFLKKFVQVILPALSAAYFALSEIWGLPNPEKVVGSIAVLSTMLGVCLGISSSTYKALGGATVGTIVVKDDGQKKSYLLELDGLDDPEDIENLTSATFKVEQRATKSVAKAVRKRAATPSK